VYRLRLCLLTILILLGTVGATNGADLDVDGVPLPADAAVADTENAPNSRRRFLGAWIGAWDGLQRHVLVVERVDPDGRADIIYAVGDLPALEIKRRWTRRMAKLDGDTLSIAGAGLITYTPLATDKLKATFQRDGQAASRARLTRVDLTALLRPDATIAWPLAEITRLETELTEAGQRIALETVLFKPAGIGSFPLLVFNHGSTGNGRQPTSFRRTRSYYALAEFFVDRGWMVAFPQRRGRGNSDGTYDEGLEPDRSKGYSCDPNLALSGVDRALGDIEAAIAALRRRADVDGKRLVIGGQSRGGILAIAYAGRHREQVLGVINFVGGWLGTIGCRSAADVVHTTMARQGATFVHPTLWLYGHGDPYYSVEHSRSNHDAFIKAGGQGAFLAFEVPGRDGHNVIAYPELWHDAVERYLTTLDRP
jgi:dienelactone hydrolase